MSRVTSYQPQTSRQVKTEPGQVNQTEQILQHLESGKSINPQEALDMYGCFRLGARIWDIKNHYGKNVKKEMVECETTGNKYAEYSLSDEEVKERGRL